ncbi:MAG: PEGA domain-containing protein [Planctomycetota bacterium]|jgi:predicted esterase
MSTVKVISLSLVLLGLAVFATGASREPPTELYVETDPPGATVLVDGKEVGTSPGLFKVEPGVREIIVKSADHDSKGGKVEARGSRITKITLHLEGTTPGGLSREQWIARLKALKGHKAAAFGVGPELAGLDPAFGSELVAAVWPQLNDFKVKQGLLKAFHFQENPHVLKVLHLGVTDPNREVREYALTYVAEYSKQEFSGNTEAYRDWYAKNRDRPLDEVKRAGILQARPSLEKKLREIVARFEAGDLRGVQNLAEEAGEHEDPIAIPILIGIIDADNSYDTVYGVGYFALGRMIGVRYSFHHDGPWWRRWWEKNKSEYPEEVRNCPIPDLSKTDHGRSYTPFPENMDTLKGQLDWLVEALQTGRPRGDIWGAAGEIAEFKDPSAIPTLIGLIEADNTYDTVYGIGYFGLGKLTGVRYNELHDGQWWRKWWEENKSRYPKDVQELEIPDYRQGAASGRKARQEANRKAALSDVADVPAEDLTVDGNDKMRYFLIGAGEGAKPPEGGYKLVIVMPGGDGGEDFHPFVRRLYKHAMSSEFLVAQPVAFKWHPSQEIVWPTRVTSTAGQKFTTEEFVEAVIQDVKRRQPIDQRRVFTLSWSSSGPAAYAISLQEETAVKGSYIAMSVFRHQWLPPLDAAKGHLYLLDHSPEDNVCPFSHAKQAEQDLAKAGATVRLTTYPGGHGWHGDIYDRVRSGLAWLVEHVQEAAPAARR